MCCCSLNVYKTASVQKRRWETLQKDGKILPQIHGLVYDVANGELKKLPVKQNSAVDLNTCNTFPADRFFSERYAEAPELLRLV